MAFFPVKKLVYIILGGRELNHIILNGFQKTGKLD